MGLFYSMYDDYEHEMVKHNGRELVIVKDPTCGYTAWISDEPSIIIEADTYGEIFTEIDLSIEAMDLFNRTECN